MKINVFLLSILVFGVVIASCKKDDKSDSNLTEDPPKNIGLISAGLANSCAIADNVVKCWGNGGDGQLGNGKRNKINPVPVNVFWRIW